MGLARLTTGNMECEYNGHTFGPAANTMYSVKSNLDPAGRTVMSATYAITVEDYIEPASTVLGNPTADPVVAAVVAKLSRNGGKLHYKGRGFGNTEINVGGGKRDVKWGPVTDEVRCECVGAGLLVKIIWTVRFTTVNCPDGLTKAGTIL